MFNKAPHRKNLIIKIIPLLLLLFIFFSCSKPKSEKHEELTDFLPQSEVEKIAEKIEKLLQNKKGTQVYSLFDGKEFYERLSIDSRQNPQVRVKEVSRIAEDNFVKNMSNSLDIASDSLQIYFIEAKQQQGNYLPLSFVWNDTAGLNFFDLFLTRNDNGKIVICDYLIYMSGELASVSLDKFISNRAKYGDDVNSKLGKALIKLTEISKLSALQNYEEAYSIYQSIPLPFNQETAFLMKKLNIVKNFSMPLYIQTLEELIKTEACKECKSLYKFYIAVAEEDQNKQRLYWNELKSNYKNKKKLEVIEKAIFLHLKNNP
ncbi:hypothetical protein ACE193_02770 [Bernardetia sp. OM2101]|uniref:hypothetical protein n=1 Tax=Bernardetia sp. OM2101 TaxID=3344876 RepID=UPI0035CED598